MAAILCLTCASFSWLGVWLLLGDRRSNSHAGMVRLQSLGHMIRRFLRMLAVCGFVQVLLAWSPYSAASEEIQSRLHNGGARFSLEESGALLLASITLSCILLALLSGSALTVVVVFGLILAGMQARVLSQKRRIERELAQEMPGVLRTMATALESGHTLVQAIEYVGLHEKGHAAEPFVRASLRLRCGMSVDDALEDLRGELRAPGVDLMVTALSISQRTGSPLRSLLQRSAVLVEQQEEFERLLAVRTAQVRLSVRVVCGLPVLMVVLLVLISPDFQQGILSGPGMVSLLLAAAMDGVALLLIRRIMGGVL